MVSEHVLRFPRSDREGAFVIVQATPIRSKALDVKLVGTDGVEPYAVSLRHDKAVSLRAKNSPCSDDEWVAILTAIVTQDPAAEVEVVASVEDEASMTLTIRKKGNEFTQRLGAIELSHSPRELIELIDWCSLSVQTANEAKEALASATARTSQLEESVRELKAQLDELIAAKEADESELLEKFRDLLNEKKVKIRQQQRLLASSSAAPGTVPPTSVKSEELTQEPNLQSARVSATGKSRPSKRKAAPAPVEDDESDDGFEKMDVDNAMEPAPEYSDQQRDTTDDEDETASEDDDDEPARPPPAKQASAKQGPAKQAPPKKDAPPAKRDLPFARKKQAAPKAPAPPAPAGSETESESDDEL